MSDAEQPPTDGGDGKGVASGVLLAAGRVLVVLSVAVFAEAVRSVSPREGFGALGLGALALYAAGMLACWAAHARLARSGRVTKQKQTSRARGMAYGIVPPFMVAYAVATFPRNGEGMGASATATVVAGAAVCVLLLALMLHECSLVRNCPDEATAQGAGDTPLAAGASPSGDMAGESGVFPSDGAVGATSVAAHGIARFFRRTARAVRKAAWAVHDSAIYAMVPLLVAGALVGHFSDGAECARILLVSVAFVVVNLFDCPSFKRFCRRVASKRHPGGGGKVESFLFGGSGVGWPWLTFSAFALALAIDIVMLYQLFR